MTIYRNEVTADHVGARVTVRHMVPAMADEATARQVPTDVVGELVAADDSHWEVRRRSGEVVTVAVATVIASKLLPPAPPRRRPRGASSC